MVPVENLSLRHSFPCPYLPQTATVIGFLCKHSTSMLILQIQFNMCYLLLPLIEWGSTVYTQLCCALFTYRHRDSFHINDSEDALNSCTIFHCTEVSWYVTFNGVSCCWVFWVVSNPTSLQMVLTSLYITKLHNSLLCLILSKYLGTSAPVWDATVSIFSKLQRPWLSLSLNRQQRQSKDHNDQNVTIKRSLHDLKWKWLFQLKKLSN